MYAAKVFVMQHVWDTNNELFMQRISSNMFVNGGDGILSLWNFIFLACRIGKFSETESQSNDWFFFQI